MTAFAFDFSGNFAERVARLGQSGAVREALAPVMERQASLVAAHVVRTRLSGDPLRRRTGSLARSVVGRAVTHRGLPAFRVGVFRGPALAYAAIHEHGGEIKPKNAKTLAMPVEGGPALTAAGVDRYGSPRNYPGQLVRIPFRRGRNAVAGLFDARDLANRGLAGSRPVYLLLRRVRIPAKHYLRDGVQEALPQAAREIGSALARLLGGAA